MVRQAEISDLFQTYEWACNPLIRKYSFNKELISFEEHRDWFSQKLSNPNCVYLLFVVGELPAGSVRFDIENRCAMISYLLDPSFHGRGLGEKLLVEGIEWLVKESIYRPEEIWGDVLEENIASIRIFEKLNFVGGRMPNGAYRFKKSTYDYFR